MSSLILSLSVTFAISNGHPVNNSPVGLVLFPTAMTFSPPWIFLNAGTNSDQICPVAPVTRILLIRIVVKYKTYSHCCVQTLSVLLLINASAIFLLALLRILQKVGAEIFIFFAASIMVIST